MLTGDIMTWFNFTAALFLGQLVAGPPRLLSSSGSQAPAPPTHSRGNGKQERVRAVTTRSLSLKKAKCDDQEWGSAIRLPQFIDWLTLGKFNLLWPQFLHL